MSPAFIKGTADSLPNAAITFDKFHAVKIINDAVDQVRRTERKDQKLLAGTRYLWLRNPDRLSERQKVIFESLPMRHLKTARAYRIRLAFQELYEQPSTEAAAAFLQRWHFWATHSRLPPIIDAARTVKRHSDGILRWFQARSPMVSSRESTASYRPPRQRLEAIAPFETLLQSSISSPESSTSVHPPEVVSTHTKQRRTARSRVFPRYRPPV